MSTLLVNVVFAFLASFPGVVVVSELFKWRLWDARSIVLGVLFWSFLFVSLSVVIGGVSTGLNYFFFFFTDLSVAVIVWWLLKMLLRRSSFKGFGFGWGLREVPLVGFIVALLVFVILIMVFHPLLAELDAVWAYIPYARGLSVTGGFFTNPFLSSSVALTRVPLIPIYYAWGISVFGEESFRLLPFVFIVLVLFVVYKFSRELFPKAREISFMAPAVFLTMPVILVSVSLYSLYVDLPLMAFTAAAVFCSFMAVRYSEGKWYVFAGVAATLAFLSKEGGYIAVVLSLVVLSLQFSRRVRLLGFLTAAFPFYFFVVRNVVTLSPENSLFMIGVVYKQVPVVLLLVLLGLILFFVSGGNRVFDKAAWRKMVFFLVPFSAFLFFVLRNWILFGRPLLTSSFSVYTVGLGELPSVFSFLRFDLLFDSTALGNLYLVLVIVGFAFLVKSLVSNKSLASGVLGVWLILLVMDWSYFYNFNFTIAEIRRLLTFAPLMSIIVAVGFSFLLNSLSKRVVKKELGFFFGWLFSSLVLFFVSVFQLDFARLSRSYLSYIVFQPYNEVLTLTTLGLAFLVFTVVVALIFLGNWLSRFKLVVHTGTPFGFSRRCRVVLSALVLASVVFVSLIPLNVLQLAADVNSSGWETETYAQNALVPSFFDSMQEVVAYYNNSLSSNYLTVSFGFGASAITTFLGRVVIDLNTGDGGYSFLLSNSTQELMNSLSSSDIKYFLMPKASSQYYPRFEEASSRILLLRLVSDTNHFVMLQDFTCYTLYTLASPSS